MSEATEAQEIELGVGDKKLRIRGSDVLGLLNMLFIGIILYGGWDHIHAAKEGTKDIAAAMRLQAEAQMKVVYALQESNCLNRLTPEQKKRSEEIEYCKRLGSGKPF